MKKRFSVIIPLYNKASYVRKAVDSVLQQTYTDFELIIVDDGSIDDSADIAAKCIAESSIVISYNLVRWPNSGVAAARNKGVSLSTGEYVVFLDADDWWETNFLEEMNRLIQDYPDAGIYAANYVYYKPGKTHVVFDMPSGYINYPKVYYATGAMPVTSITACMPRSVFDEMGGFPSGIRLGEDFLLWAKIAVHYKVAYSNKPLAYYNNDVPTSLRATRNLHAPQYHMLFNLGSLEREIEQAKLDSKQSDSWKALLDKLRATGLLQYWLEEEYHDQAAAELAKVDWTRQPQSVIRQYKMPICILRLHRQFMCIGSYCKQKLIRLCYKI